MRMVHDGLLGLHVLLGTIGLISFWLPALTRKGGKLHRKSGWFYVWAMLGVVVTAGLLSLLLLAIPLVVRPASGSLTPAKIARHVLQVRATGVFFGYISLLTFTAGWQGLNVLRAKQGIAGMKTPFNIGLLLLNVVCGLGGIYMGWRMGQILFTIFGWLTFASGAVFLYRLRRNREVKMYWWMEHLSGMITTGIAAYTAFFVNGGARLMDRLFAQFPNLQLIPWIAPTILGTFCTIYLRRIYKRKFAAASSSSLPIATETIPETMPA